MKKLKYLIVNNFKDDHGFLINYIKTRIPRNYYRKSIRKKMNNNKVIMNYNLTQESTGDINKYWKGILGYKVYLDWHRAYYITNGIEDCKYVPEDVFYKIVEPSLNNYSLEKAYSDKNFYSKIFHGLEMPKVLLRNINGNFYDEKYALLNEKEAINILLQYNNHKFVIKPSLDTGGGRNVKIINKEEFESCYAEKNIYEILMEFKEDYLVQEYINQHKLISDIHPNSLNTLRIISLRYKGKIYILSRIIRMGNQGNVLDNSTLGGLACGYSSKGILNSFATEHYSFIKHEFHPYTKVYFNNRIIPNYKDIDNFVKKLHEKLHYFDIASWDIGVKEDGIPVFIEVNLRDQDINFHQRNNGPLFGDMTEEIIRYVKTI